MRYRYMDLANFRDLFKELKLILERTKNKDKLCFKICKPTLNEIDHNLRVLKNIKAQNTTKRKMPFLWEKEMSLIHIELGVLRIILISFKYLKQPLRKKDVLVCQ